jgi:PAS domain S-box-containing protein
MSQPTIIVVNASARTEQQIATVLKHADMRCDLVQVGSHRQLRNALRRSEKRHDGTLIFIEDPANSSVKISEIRSALIEQEATDPSTRVIPIILLHSGPESVAINESLRFGCNDFLLLPELSRLSLVLRAAEERQQFFSERTGQFEEISKREERFRSLIENVLDIITIVDISGTIKYESPSLLPTLGYRPEELLGRNAFSMIHPIDVPKVMPIFMLALATPGVPHSTKFRFKHLNGSWRSLEAVGKCVKDPIFGTVLVVTSRDITDRSRAEAALGESESRFKMVIESLSEGLLISDKNSKVLYLNSRFSQLTGYTPAEVISEPAFERLLDSSLWAIAEQCHQNILHGENHTYEVELKRKDGSKFWASVNETPYRDGEGDIVGGLYAVFDISERKSIEFQLVHAKDRAEEMNRLKTAFLTNMSHEIRTPMNAILGFAEELVTRLPTVGPDAELREYAETISRSGERLLATINSVLDLAKIEANKIELNLQPVGLRQEAERIVSLLGPKASAKGLSLRVFELSQGLEAVADPQYLGQVLINLIGNAIKFTESGSVMIEIDSESTGHEGGHVVIRVRDTGIGISSEFLPHLFDEFKQESAGWARNYEGTGLGLTITKRLVELMAGSIGVTSGRGKGTCFTVRLPLALQDTRNKRLESLVPEDRFVLVSSSR